MALAGVEVAVREVIETLTLVKLLVETVLQKAQLL